MSHPRERYNAKARQSTAGGSSRKKGKHHATKPYPSQDQVDPNAVIHVPKSQEEKELERKDRLREELAAQSDSKMNSKKKKRLDKYIEKKLKKEERLVILEKLSQSQSQLPTTSNLQSSSTLGTGKVSTNRERLERLENKEVRRLVEGRAGKRKRQGDDYAVIGAGGSDVHTYEDEEDISGSKAAPDIREAQMQDVAVVDTAAQLGISESFEVGSALQKNPDGSVIAPRVITKRKGKKIIFQSWRTRRGGSTPHPVDADSDTSFDSSDSAYDTSEDGTDDNEGDADAGESEEDEEVTSEEGEEANTAEPISSPPKRKLGFKDWALKQLSAAKGYDPPTNSLLPQSTAESDHPDPLPPPTKKRKIEDSDKMRGPLGEDLHLPATSLAQHLQTSATAKKTKRVSVTRPVEAEEARLLLPIVAEEQPIMEAVLLNPVVIICGETGSGKTTQVPQFLYEAGFGSPGSENPGMIGVTQPRRVAAMSMAARVAHELSLTSSRISYQIRYDATVSPTTAIKFMTDGVLLRELATDFLLTKYSVIIIDEAHERSMNTDILIGVLSRVLKLREEMWKEGKEDIKPLRLVIMSATLRVSDFAENKTLFPSPPPVLNISARQHPVTVHFNRRTPSDYVTEAAKKASKIHSRLPPGGILIFLTGQNEITGVCRKLEAKFGLKALTEKRKRRGRFSAIRASDDVNKEDKKRDAQGVAPAQADVEAEEVDLGDAQPNDLAFDVDDDLADEDPDALDSDNERLADDEELGIDPDEIDTPMHIVPLYSLLPNEKQMRVFESPPSGARLVVVSTNVAETSLTIPGIRYVIDSGRVKERQYNVKNGIQAFQISWISKASAAQRAGRAGRTGPGHCYRLYSSALFEHYFDPFSQPEILRIPNEGVVLQMKSMHIDAVVNFPFPTPPDRTALRKAENVLTYLGAISSSSSKPISGSTGGQITELGKAMSLFPLSPRFSRMLVSGRQKGCLPYVISIVAALSVGDPFLREEGLDSADEESDNEDEDELDHIKNEAVKAKEARKIRRRAFFKSQQTHASLGRSSSDIFRMLSVIGAYEYAGGGHKFCIEHFVRPKAMEEVHKLRAQISNIVQTNFPDVDPGFVPNLQPPSDLQIKILRQLLAAAFIDQVAIRKDLIEKGSSQGLQYASSRGVPYRAMGISEDVFVHPSSVLVSASPPDYVVFNEIVRTTKLWIKGLTVVNAAWLSSLGKLTLCSFSKPIKNSAGTMMVIPRFGLDGWELPPVKADT